MALDIKAADTALQGLKPIPSAITTVSGERSNGMISLSLALATTVPDAHRVMVGVNKYNFSHDLIAESGLFAAHVLSGAPDDLDASLRVLMTLGGTSGRDSDKLADLATETGVTGLPVLQDALAYVECRVVNSMDAQECTFFLADVVHAGVLRKGPKLTIGQAWGALPPEWLAAYDLSHHAQIEDCRARRGLTTSTSA